jgi:hypothetical protein
LIDRCVLAADNPLLDVIADEADGDRVRHVPLVGGDPVQMAAMLAQGAAFAIESGDQPSELEVGRLRCRLPAAEIAHRLLSIRRITRSQLIERGEHTLWLGLGTLVWFDADGLAHSAPLALWPVAIERNAPDPESWRVISAHDAIEGVEPCVNPLLAEKLRRDFELVLPDPSSPLDLEALLAAADGIVTMRAGWKVERDARLGVYASTDVTIWRDLERLADRWSDRDRTCSRT